MLGMPNKNTSGQSTKKQQKRGTLTFQLCSPEDSGNKKPNISGPNNNQPDQILLLFV